MFLLALEYKVIYYKIEIFKKYMQRYKCLLSLKFQYIYFRPEKIGMLWRRPSIHEPLHG